MKNKKILSVSILFLMLLTILGFVLATPKKQKQLESASITQPKNEDIFKTKFCKYQNNTTKLATTSEIVYTNWSPLEIESSNHTISDTAFRDVYQCAYDKKTKLTVENFVGIQNKHTYRGDISEVIKLPWRTAENSFHYSKYAGDNHLLMAECETSDNANDFCPKIRLVEFTTDPSHTLYSDGYTNKIYASVNKYVDLYSIPGLETYNFENLFISNVIPVQVYIPDGKPEVRIVIIMPEKIIQLNPITKEVKSLATAKKDESFALSGYESSAISTSYSILGNRLYHISYYNKQNPEGEIAADLENPKYNFVEIK